MVHAPPETAVSCQASRELPVATVFAWCASHGKVARGQASRRRIPGRRCTHSSLPVPAAHLGCVVNRLVNAVGIVAVAVGGGVRGQVVGVGAGRHPVDGAIVALLAPAGSTGTARARSSLSSRAMAPIAHSTPRSAS